jgi:hypothetical protein
MEQLREALKKLNVFTSRPANYREYRVTLMRSRRSAA